ncbi:transposase [Candidatus Sororendozoicomonas aggregata]|uniref:transposase n=1 Tax=Candidatus Sororendozoicomonas aggregata TaxID=3073239 RepID=UPI003B75BB5A
MGQPMGIAFLIPPPLVVCNNLRIMSHRVFSGMVKSGKTSTGWTFGFKLHLVISHLGWKVCI